MKLEASMLHILHHAAAQKLPQDQKLHKEFRMVIRVTVNAVVVLRGGTFATFSVEW